jgi:putative secretion ATPase (PEP-CTERM system associated)
MYSDQYGFNGKPFQLTPDPRFWFESATHKKAMAYLGYGLAQGEGFIVVTGDIGAGKTTLVAHLLDTVDPARIAAVQLVSTQVDREDMLRLIARSMGTATDGLDKASLLAAIEAALEARARTGQRTLLIVDEAQNLPVGSLEELRMLTNFQSGGQARLQVLLLGQPEFRQLIETSALQQLRQRVIATHHLTPMEPGEVEAYILHRMKLVGWQGNPEFAADCFDAFHRHSGGLPRRINQIAERVLLMAAIERKPAIDAALVDAVVADMDAETPPAPVAVIPSAEQALDLAARVAMLEAQVAEQDVALRRILRLLVDWAEGDARSADANGFVRAPAA